jgi:PAS domain-containing protein
MIEKRRKQRTRTLRGAKILFNNKRSVISCTVRNLSADGVHLNVQSTIGIPAFFDLVIDGDDKSIPCDLMWKADNRIGVAFSQSAVQSAEAAAARESVSAAGETAAAPGAAIRSELLALRAALDEIGVGIVLLNAGLKAQFINRAFRRLWNLPDAKAEARPAFATLLHHGRDTHAYDIPESNLNAYIEERIEHVRAGTAAPIDLRLASGAVIRFQCMKIPAGGRMLTYTDVTDLAGRKQSA